MLVRWRLLRLLLARASKAVGARHAAVVEDGSGRLRACPGEVQGGRERWREVGAWGGSLGSVCGRGGDGLGGGGGAVVWTGRARKDLCQRELSVLVGGERGGESCKGHISELTPPELGGERDEPDVGVGGA